MQRTWLVLSVVIPISLGVLLGMLLAFMSAQANAATAAVKCHRNASFTVLERERADGAGNDITLRKSTADAKADCAKAKRPDDRAMSRGDDALYFIGMAGDLLVLDNGTGTVRALTVIDAQSGKRLLNATFAPDCDVQAGQCKADIFSLTPQGVLFWREMKPQAKATDCGNYAEAIKATGAAALEQQAFFDFASRKLEMRAGRSCSPRE